MAHLTELSSSLLQDSSLLDISIQCGPELVRSHKLVLSACSPWFREVFCNMPANPSPLVVLWETKMADMKNILSFMYNGEVQVEQDNLLSFLKLAKYLQVKGLTEEKDNVDHAENTEKVLHNEGKNEKKPRIEDTNKSPSGNSLARREDPRARENSRPRSRMMDDTRTRKETASESRLRKEDFELKREDVKEKREILSENIEKNSSLG